jgi:hypothetical protein
LSSPRIDQVGSPGRLEWVGLNLLPGQTLELDSQARTAKLNGTADRVPSTRDWFRLPPGDSQVQLTAASGSGSLSIDYRDAWL